jgi:hypothetical protein
MWFLRRRPAGLTGATGPTGAKEVEDEVARAKLRNATTDSRLRQYLGYGALLAMPIQLVVKRMIPVSQVIIYLTQGIGSARLRFSDRLSRLFAGLLCL